MVKLGYKLITLLVASLLISCNGTSNNSESIKSGSGVFISEVSKQLEVIAGTEKLSQCPADMFPHTNEEDIHVCIKFLNDETSTEALDYTAQYEDLLQKTEWNKISTSGHFSFFRKTNERPSKDSLKPCGKMLGMATWYDGNAELVNKAMKNKNTAQFKHKILALSISGNECS